MSIPSTGTLRISDTGSYHVVFGVACNSANEGFELRLGGAGDIARRLFTYQVGVMITTSMIIEVTTNPTDLTFVSIISAANLATFLDDSLQGEVPVFVATIIKLSD